ncbi:acetyl-CoA C-acetyltransferase [Spirosomataceae bacterium TFI 002]|nr:acetyl-CoA C-acetyltransferase [Spirosomataceae bacterium TFI 002]
MTEVFIIGAKRTPLGSFGGVFKNTSATDLGATAMKAALIQSGVPDQEIDEVLFGNVVSANLGQGPARQSALQAGVPNSVPATTLNKLCASGMKATMFAAQSIQLGQNHVVIAGGMENMTRIPFYLDKARNGYGYGNDTLIDGLYRDGLQDAYALNPMGCFADATARKHEISREKQDTYAIQSYKRAAAAWANGVLKNEVCPVELKDRKGNVTNIEEDEEYKKVFFDKIPNLRPVFEKEGTVTAANASTINDGAAALVLASKSYVEQNNIKPLARIVAYADAAQEPAWFTTAPIIATDKVLKIAGMELSEMELFEVNEAFSVVPLAYAKHFGISQEIMNIHGGAVSLGHPLGCSGARILVTLLNALATKNAKYGMAAICNGGGGASAMIVERL